MDSEDRPEPSKSRFVRKGKKLKGGGRAAIFGFLYEIQNRPICRRQSSGRSRSYFFYDLLGKERSGRFRREWGYRPAFFSDHSERGENPSGGL
jgi:hypothetical protein